MHDKEPLTLKDRLKPYYLGLSRLIFPRIFCPVCGERLTEGEICDKCMASLPKYRRCEGCGSFLHPTSYYCNTCSKMDKLCFKRNISAFPYEGEFCRSIVRLKYKDKKYLRYAFSQILAEQIRSEYADIAFELALPVPTPPLRLKQRGYNQVELYARLTAEELHIPFSDSALYTIRENPSLVGKKRTERLQAVKGAFAADEAQVKGKTVLLFDDVFTSGATLNACSKALKMAGAAEVYGAVLAGHWTLN